MTEGAAPRSRATAIGVLFAVAIASGLAGAAADRTYVKHAMRFVGDTGFHPISSILRAPTDAERKQFRDELAEALALTPDQSRVIDSITSSHIGQFDDLRSMMRPRIEGLVNAVRTDVEKVLTPEQRTKYRQLQGRPTTSPPGGSPR
jgi:hypothetical protein